MFKSKSIKICERFSAHRWAKSRHVLLIALTISSLFVFSPKASFAKNYNGLNAENKNKSLIKKISVLFLAFSICFLCFSIVGSSLASAATVYVDTDGSGNYNCDGTNDHIEINKALTDTYNLGGGTVYLRGPNTYWIDATLEIGSNTILTGDSSACIKLVPNAGWAAEVPLIKNKSGAQKDITIKGFEIDGNSESQSVSRGKGYYNLMYFENCKGVTVTDMRLEWGTGDGLKVKNKPYSYTSSADITFTGNSVYKLGHDALYVLGMNGVTVANNDVFTRTNSAFRLSSSGNAKIYNNVIHSEIGTGGTSTGPGIEIDKSSGYKSENIEIYNNIFHTLNGAAIWIDGEDTDNVIRGKNVYIHHNTMYNVGQYGTNTGYSNAAITLGQFDNTRIENNVIDNGGHAGIKYYQYTNSYKMSAKFTTYVNNNIIMNCAKNVATGVWNYNSANHKFVLNNNCIYKNTNDAYTGSNIEHSGDIYVDPQFVSSTTRDYHLQSKAGHYSSGKWVADSTSSPLIDAGYSESSYSNEPSPNGGRINIGRYGNTAQASKSSSTVSNEIDAKPVANAGSDKTVPVGSTVLFNGNSSTDDKGIATYSWDFDASNGITSEATGVTATKKYTSGGTYTVTLTVTDTASQTATDTVNVIVSGTTTTPTDTTPDTTTSTGSSVSYSPTYDNRLRSDSTSTVYSTSTYLDIGKSSAAARDLMLFDLSSYKTTDTISKATLSLYWYYPAGATRTSDTVVEVYRPIAWDPKYVSWNNRASGTAWSTAGGNWYDKNGVAQGSTPYATLTFSASTLPGNKYYDFDVTQLVKEYISGKYTNTGFFIKARTESGNYIAFYSAESSNTAMRPKLTISSTSGGSTTADSTDSVPVANAGSDKNTATNSAVTFDGSASTDDKGIASYSWDFNASNGITSEATGKTATKTFTTAGTYTVTLTVTDTAGQTATDTANVVVSGATSVDAAPVANAGSDKTAVAGSSLSFSGSASTDDKGIATYSWDFDASNGVISEATGVTTAKTYTTAGTYIVTLTVTDTAGQKATDSVNVVVSGTTPTPTDTPTSTGTSVSYSPTYDNRLRSDSASTVYSTSTYLDIGRSSATARDVMLFDLSSYKTTDTISKATLSLYWYYPASTTRTSDTVVEVYRPVAWDPKYVSWNNRASGTAWSTAGGNWYDKNGVAQGSTPYATLTFPASTVPGNKYYDFDVTQLVQEYISGKYTNTGFFIKARTESGNYIAFYSSKYSNTAMRPKLTVTS